MPSEQNSSRARWPNFHNFTPVRLGLWLVNLESERTSGAFEPQLSCAHLNTRVLGDDAVVLAGHEEPVVGELLEARVRVGRGDVLRVAPPHVVHAHIVLTKRDAPVAM